MYLKIWSYLLTSNVESCCRGKVNVTSIADSSTSSDIDGGQDVKASFSGYLKIGSSNDVQSSSGDSWTSSKSNISVRSGYLNVASELRVSKLETVEILSYIIIAIIHRWRLSRLNKIECLKTYKRSARLKNNLSTVDGECSDDCQGLISANNYGRVWSRSSNGQWEYSADSLISDNSECSNVADNQVCRRVSEEGKASIGGRRVIDSLRGNWDQQNRQKEEILHVDKLYKCLSCEVANKVTEWMRYLTATGWCWNVRCHPKWPFRLASGIYCS